MTTASEGRVPPVSERTAPTATDVATRLDGLTRWSLPYLAIAIIGVGFLFTFYDIFDINVSFIQTCIALKPGCTPATALGALKVPVALNVAGYVVGTLVLSPMCDRIGRRNMLLVTMLVTGIGSLYTALAPDYANFVGARVLTGVGIGADLAVVNTYIGEVAPRHARARFTSMIFVMSAVGALLGIWLGLILTTPAAPWPTGLPFAVAGPRFADGWRWMYAVGALLALVGVALRAQLPESPRWLLGQGRVLDAERVVAMMERHQARRGTVDGARAPSTAVETTVESRLPFLELFRDRRYLRRLVLLLATWFAGYITVYSYASGFTSVLASLHYPPPEAGVIVAVGAFGFLLGSLITSVFAESLERKHWLPISAAITLAGAAIVAEAGKHIGVSFLGSGLIFVGFNMWVSPTYALSAECFPSRARSTGFGIVDGIGHLGGGIGILVLAPYIPKLSPLAALMLISGFLVVAAVIVQWAPATRGAILEEVSP